MFRVAILQYPILWADKEANTTAAVHRIEMLAGKADVALLPEMFSTGFCTDHPELAESEEGPTLCALQKTADLTGVAICSTFICRSNDGTLRNRGFFLCPNGTPTFVDKAHLYAHGGEDRFFTAGRERTVIEYKGVRMRLIICYDLRFPIWARNLPDNPYDSGTRDRKPMLYLRCEHGGRRQCGSALQRPLRSLRYAPDTYCSLQR